MIFKAKIDTADIDTIVLKNYLEQCTEGDEIYYKSTAYANFDGCFIEIRGDTLKCKCSIHKLYSRGKSGKLDNSRPMTFGHAGRTINELLLRLCAKIENVIVTYYEIGVTMKMSMPADAYIRQVEEAAGRVLWNDANYPEFRQKLRRRANITARCSRSTTRVLRQEKRDGMWVPISYVSRPCINTSQYRWRDSLIMHT